MSDWKYLNEHRVRGGLFSSDDSYGFNGAFFICVDGCHVRCIASDGGGWKHVSVSQAQSKHPPRWSVMCAVKDLFFEPEDWVIQFHPAHSEYVNNHEGCLHLWQCTNAVQPIPPSEMVGLKGKTSSDIQRMSVKELMHIKQRAEITPSSQYAS